MGEFNPKPHLIDIRGKQYLEVKSVAFPAQ